MKKIKRRYGFMFIKQKDGSFDGALWDRKTTIFYTKINIPREELSHNWQRAVKYFKGGEING